MMLDEWLRNCQYVPDKDKFQDYQERYAYLSQNLAAMSVDASVDLHSCTVAQAATLLHEFLQQCVVYGDCIVRIIHGKGNRSQGKAKIKHFVQQWCRDNAAYIKLYQEASQRNGGAGATILWVYSSDSLDYSVGKTTLSPSLSSDNAAC